MSLTEEQTKSQPLLEHHAVIIAPNEIEHDGYVELSWALAIGRVLYPDRPLELRCCGVGGDAGRALAVADLIQADGNVDGIAIGRVASGHSILWASCPRRFVYPNVRVSVHQAYDGDWTNNHLERDFSLAARNYQWINQRMIAIYAAASNKDHDFWHDAIYNAGIEMRDFDHDSLIDIGMARPIACRQNIPPLQVGEGARG